MNKKSKKNTEKNIITVNYDIKDSVVSIGESASVSSATISGDADKVQIQKKIESELKKSPDLIEYHRGDLGYKETFKIIYPHRTEEEMMKLLIYGYADAWTQFQNHINFLEESFKKSIIASYIWNMFVEEKYAIEEGRDFFFNQIGLTEGEKEISDKLVLLMDYRNNRFKNIIIPRIKILNKVLLDNEIKYQIFKKFYEGIEFSAGNLQVKRSNMILIGRPIELKDLPEEEQPSYDEAVSGYLKEVGEEKLSDAYNETIFESRGFWETWAVDTVWRVLKDLKDFYIQGECSLDWYCYYDEKNQLKRTPTLRISLIKKQNTNEILRKYYEDKYSSFIDKIFELKQRKAYIEINESRWEYEIKREYIKNFTLCLKDFKEILLISNMKGLKNMLSFILEEIEHYENKRNIILTPDICICGTDYPIFYAILSSHFIEIDNQRTA